MNNNNDLSTQITGFSNADMDFQMVRQLGASVYRGSSIGECFTIANKIKNASIEEWVNEFARLAEWQKKDGIERLVKNHIVSGREQLFRASNSFRAAEYYSPMTSEQHKRFGFHSADCFCTAISGMDVHFENHSIPYNDINLPAYFISPANDGVKRKTIMILSDFDGTMEEEFLLRGFAGIQRDYNIILFAGPGSIDVCRKYSDSHYTPDFEQVIKRIINHFEFRHEVDKNHLALMGVGTGAYFAIRAACYEPRIKALIVNSPILNLHSYLRTVLGANLAQIADINDLRIEDLADLANNRLTAQQKAPIEHFISRLGQGSLHATLEYLMRFEVCDELNAINIPCLALIGDHEDQELQRQYEQFCKKLDAAQYKFSDFEGAGSHCQIGNTSFANAVTYDWLDWVC